MKAQDLRIKNIVNNSSGDPITLSIYNILSLWQWELQIDKYKGDPPFTPIPLIEKWLLNGGYERVKPRDGVARAYKFKNIRINMSNTGNFYFNKLYVDYVHEFQNLHFALTNEELTIKD